MDKKALGGDRKTAKGELRHGREKPNLTDAQKAEVLKLNAEYKAKTDTLQHELRRSGRSWPAIAWRS